MDTTAPTSSESRGLKKLGTLFGLPVYEDPTMPSTEIRIESRECLAPPIKRDPDCDHDSDPVEKAIYILADCLLKHFQTAKHWDCSDFCWLEAVEEAKSILNNWKSKA